MKVFRNFEFSLLERIKYLDAISILFPAKLYSFIHFYTKLLFIALRKTIQDIDAFLVYVYPRDKMVGFVKRSKRTEHLELGFELFSITLKVQLFS